MTTFVYYEDELKQRWIDNINSTKSKVLQRDDENGDLTSGGHYFRQFNTKIPEWNGSKTRNKDRGS